MVKHLILSIGPKIRLSITFWLCVSRIGGLYKVSELAEGWYVINGTTPYSLLTDPVTDSDSDSECSRGCPSHSILIHKVRD